MSGHNVESDPDCPEINFWPDSPRSEGSDEESIRERWTRVTPPGADQ